MTIYNDLKIGQVFWNPEMNAAYRVQSIGSDMCPVLPLSRVVTLCIIPSSVEKPVEIGKVGTDSITTTPYPIGLEPEPPYVAGMFNPAPTLRITERLLYASFTKEGETLEAHGSIDCKLIDTPVWYKLLDYTAWKQISPRCMLMRTNLYLSIGGMEYFVDYLCSVRIFNVFYKVAHCNDGCDDFLAAISDLEANSHSTSSRKTSEEEDVSMDKECAILGIIESGISTIKLKSEIDIIVLETVRKLLDAISLHYSYDMTKAQWCHHGSSDMKYDEYDHNVITISTDVTSKYDMRIYLYYTLSNSDEDKCYGEITVYIGPDDSSHCMNAHLVNDGSEWTVQMELHNCLDRKEDRDRLMGFANALMDIIGVGTIHLGVEQGPG